MACIISHMLFISNVSVGKKRELKSKQTFLLVGFDSLEKMSLLTRYRKTYHSHLFFIKKKFTCLTI